MMTLRSMDNPWRRLPWTLPAALLIWSIALWGLAYFMERSTHRPVALPPIEVALMEEPASTSGSPGNSNLAGQVTDQPAHPEPPAPVAPPKPVQPEPPAPVPTPKPVAPVKPRKPPVIPKVSHPIRHNLLGPKAETATNATEAPNGTVAGPGMRQGTAEGNTSADSGAPTGSLDQKGSSPGSMFANSAARAIIQPRPIIPEDLRVGALISSALVRFRIAVDGSAEVELTKPTQDPRLNRILLDTLKKWRFMPAIKSGKPVASTEEIIVKIEVR